jgi:hypothetical protein
MPKSLRIIAALLFVTAQLKPRHNFAYASAELTRLAERV